MTDLANSSTLLPARHHREAHHARLEVARIATAELQATLSLLHTLGSAEWQAPTDCTGWSVRQLVTHLLGQYQEQANPVLMLRRIRLSRRRYPRLPSLAAHNQVQLDDLANLEPDQLLTALAAAGPRGIRACRRAPAVLRRIDSRRIFPDEVLVDQRLSYIFDVLTLRDPWMHRIDLCSATGRSLTFDEHDASIMDGVMRELANQWRAPAVRIHLADTTGGPWTLGSATAAATTADAGILPDITLSALQVMRSLAGRPIPAGAWPRDADPRILSALQSARIVF
jgi:uncharacterized protein (TIGR03083 family)